MTMLSADFVEREYNLRQAFPDHPQWFARWSEESAAARSRLDSRLGIRYGSGPKQTLDLFPAASPRGAEGRSFRSSTPMIASRRSRP